MLLALIALTAMLLGTVWLAAFGRHVASLLDKWGRGLGRRRAPNVRSGAWEER